MRYIKFSTVVRCYCFYAFLGLLLVQHKVLAQKPIYIGKIFKGPNLPNLDYRGSIEYVFKINDNMLAVSGECIWKIDATSTGTVRLIAPNKFKEFNLVECRTEQVSEGVRARPNQMKSYKSYRFEKNGHFYFVASEQDGGTTLWASDGTVQGTQPLKGVFQVGKFSYISILYIDVDKFYFGRYEVKKDPAEQIYELWESDGSASGTVKIYESKPGEPLGSIIINGNISMGQNDAPFDINKKPYIGFSTINIKTGKINFPVQSDCIGYNNSFSKIDKISHLNDKLIFWSIASNCKDFSTGFELHTTDGEKQAVLVKNINLNKYLPTGSSQKEGNPIGAGIVDLEFTKGEAFFMPFEFNEVIIDQKVTRVGNKRLWRTDGTSAGTTPVAVLYEEGQFIGADITADQFTKNVFVKLTSYSGVTVGCVKSGEHSFTKLKDFQEATLDWCYSYKNKYYFVAKDFVDGWGIWESDGSKEGTRLLTNFLQEDKRIKETLAESGCTIIGIVNDKLFFTSENIPIDYGKSYELGEWMVNLSTTPLTSKVSVSNRYKQLALENLKLYNPPSKPATLAKTCSYVKMYLSNPKLFKWAGLAALASRDVGIASEKWFTNFDIIGLTRTVLNGNEQIYLDLYWQHLLVRDKGIAGIKEVFSEKAISAEMLEAWSEILGGNEEQIWSGNKKLLYHEQKIVAQPMYDEKQKAFTVLSSFPSSFSITSPVPNHNSVFPGGLYNRINIQNFDDRWLWVTNDIWPAWRKFESNPANKTLLVDEYNKVCPNQIVDHPKADLPFMDMMHIPGGTFNMGSTTGMPNEKPIHSVTISPFLMGKYEVTVGQFAQFVTATGYKTEAEKNGIKAWNPKTNQVFDSKDINWRHDEMGNMRPESDYSYPVAYVTYNDALAFAVWLSKRDNMIYRLPTEAEWEYAAGNGVAHTKYSWGNNEPTGQAVGNVGDETFLTELPLLSNYNPYRGVQDGYAMSSPVGTFASNKFGLYDMTGNLNEWCADWYGEKYYATSSRLNPLGPATGVYRTVKGGSWLTGPSTGSLTTRGFTFPSQPNINIGFRVVSPAK